jgi:hypothetical protein
MQTSDSLNNGGVYGELTVGTSAVELKVGANRLANRKMIQIQARDINIYFGYSNAVTSANGTELFKRQLILIPVGVDTQVWLIADVANKKVRIAEIA